jgi:hypothetical protein
MDARLAKRTLAQESCRSRGDRSADYEYSSDLENTENR